jgi:hypothetical protein
VGGDIARSSATALPERVIVICSPRAARSTTSPLEEHESLDDAP